MRFFERGWLSSNNILFLDDESSASVVDTGYVSHATQTEALLEAALGGRRLTRILNTHLHSDHCGGNAHLAARWGATIAIPPGSAQAVRHWDADALTFMATGQRCPRFDWQGLLEPGTVVRLGALDWEVFAAPGHDPHSVVLWCDSERLLISADALWEQGFGVIFPEIEGKSGFTEQAAMIELIARLAPRVVLPGHGRPFTEVDAALERARERLAALAASPARNARHAARALLKFYLLEVREAGFDALVAHCAAARYFPLINQRYFGQPFEDFVRMIAEDLVRADAARVRDNALHNHEA
jgi:glyoxylase-like metal-dependent hydrolase (beta-lactamase superfamily II)